METCKWVQKKPKEIFIFYLALKKKISRKNFEIMTKTIQNEIFYYSPKVAYSNHEIENLTLKHL
jgi:hypothetical protein